MNTWIEISIAILGIGLVLLIGWIVLQDVKEEYKYAEGYCRKVINGPVPMNDSRSNFTCINGRKSVV